MYANWRFVSPTVVPYSSWTIAFWRVKGEVVLENRIGELKCSRRQRSSDAAVRTLWVDERRIERPHDSYEHSRFIPPVGWGTKTSTNSAQWELQLGHNKSTHAGLRNEPVPWNASSGGVTKRETPSNNQAASGSLKESTRDDHRWTCQCANAGVIANPHR